MRVTKSRKRHIAFSSAKAAKFALSDRNALVFVGAGEGNRTLVISLEGCMFFKHFCGLAAKLYAFTANGIK